MSETEQDCPFCRTSLHSDAITCHGCHAHQGYPTKTYGDGRADVLTKEDVQTRMFLSYGAAILSFIGMVVLAMTGTADSWAVLAITIPTALLGWFYSATLRRGPRWVRDQ